MYVFELTTPGTWLDYPDQDWVWNVAGILRNLQEQLYEANTALNLFEGAEARPSSQFNREQQQADAEHRAQVRRAMAREADSDSHDFGDRISHEAEIRFKREKWSNGHVPRELEQKVVFIFARAFVYALDGFDKFLGVLAKEHGVPPCVADLSVSIDSLFPDLRGVRNTSQHLEDRSRGLGPGRNPKQMTLQPVENGMISAPGGGVLVLNSLNGNRFGCTMSDGHYGEVEISPQSVKLLYTLLQEVFGCFQWVGPIQHFPSA